MTSEPATDLQASHENASFFGLESGGGLVPSRGVAGQRSEWAGWLETIERQHEHK